MAEANIVRDYYIGLARIRFADNYCKKTDCETDEALDRIAEEAQRHFIAAATAKKKHEENKYITEDCGSRNSGSNHNDGNNGDKRGGGHGGNRDCRNREHVQSRLG